MNSPLARAGKKQNRNPNATIAEHYLMPNIYSEYITPNEHYTLCLLEQTQQAAAAACASSSFRLHVSSVTLSVMHAATSSPLSNLLTITRHIR
mmetsp:Transcript_24776/g.40887  ORF Transcript_24776/g.40887 Transcript_24776/m.40887 type:complete len:93 (+) Transcript_24776:983-1261(+)